MTEATPRHSLRVPSVDEMRVKASDMLLYTAAGEVERTCILVCEIAAQRERLGISCCLIAEKLGRVEEKSSP